MPGTVHIGTSGWHYRHWRGLFYPEKLAASKHLQYYAERLRTVELNNTFYRLPSQSAAAHWRDSTPSNFCFAVKGSRFLTHMKKLRDPALGIERFFERASILGSKLGPIVFQLPPNWEVDPGRLDTFLTLLPPGHQYAFEFRNPTWHVEPVCRILRQHNAAFCIFEIGGLKSGFEVTADFTYIRLHGPGGAYQGLYSDPALQSWANRIRDWQERLRGIYLYFDNDQAGYAVENAIALQQMLETQ
jgi:uncharacterized protein YecE (DUF72 family)